MQNIIKRLFERKVSREEEEWKVCRKEVIHCFLKADFEKDSADYGDLALPELLKMDLPTLDAILEGPEDTEDTEHTNSYKASPVSQWTMMGIRGRKIDSWVLRKGVPLKECWTAGIDKRKTKDAEDKVSGNLVLLGKSKHSAAKAEFENCKMPPPDKQTLIGILQRKDSRKGKIQLLDGAHRLVAMWRNRFRKTDMYLGTLTPKGHYDEGSWDPESRRPPKYDF